MPRQHTSIGLLALILIVTLAQPSYAQNQQNVQIRSEDGLLTVKANNASAKQLADVLSDQLGINVVLTGDIETLINIDIVEEPLDKALTKLSPNTMLVRAGEEPDSEIVEIVLLLGEGSRNSSTGAGSGQFLPSGSPAQENPVSANGDDPEPTDAGILRDPNRAQLVRDAAGAAANDAGLPAAQQTGEYSSDFDVPIDPETGFPIQPQ